MFAISFVALFVVLLMLSYYYIECILPLLLKLSMYTLY